MGSISILPAYVSWHYSEALADIVRIWTNFIWFFYHFFSIPLLFKTLFVPLHRVRGERTTRGFNFEEVAGNFVVNIMMRGIGFILRTILILAGALFMVIVFWLGLIALTVWILMPIVLAALIFFGFSLITS